MCGGGHVLTHGSTYHRLPPPPFSLPQLAEKPLMSEELSNYLYGLPPVDVTADEQFKVRGLGTWSLELGASLGVIAHPHPRSALMHTSTHAHTRTRMQKSTHHHAHRSSTKRSPWPRSGAPCSRGLMRRRRARRMARARNNADHAFACVSMLACLQAVYLEGTCVRACTSPTRGTQGRAGALCRVSLVSSASSTSGRAWMATSKRFSTLVES